MGNSLSIASGRVACRVEGAYMAATEPVAFWLARDEAEETLDQLALKLAALQEWFDGVSATAGLASPVAARTDPVFRAGLFATAPIPAGGVYLQARAQKGGGTL